MAVAARSPARPLRFALQGQDPFLEVNRVDGLDLLEWVGVGRAEFGAIDASALRPLCRRRLWAEQRNLAPFVTYSRLGVTRTRESGTLRALAIRITNALEGASGALIHFG